MKTAAVLEFRNDFRRVSAWVAEGQSIAITQPDRLVTRLSLERPR